MKHYILRGIPMSIEKTAIDEKAAILGEEIKQQFAIAGEEAKQQLLASFQSVLENDVNNLKLIVSKAVEDNNSKIKVQLQKTLNQAIKQQFGGSIFGGALQNLILPAVFQGISDGKVDFGSQNFKEAASQTILDIGKSIGRSQSRNG